MMTNKITVFPATPRWNRYWSKSTAPPCRLCALAVQIEAGADHGRWCLWYRIRLPSAELQGQLSEVRRHCLRDGRLPVAAAWVYYVAVARLENEAYGLVPTSETHSRSSVWRA